MIRKVDPLMEIKALEAFQNNLDGEVKEYIKNSIAVILKGTEGSELFSTQEKINMVTDIVILSIKWKLEYSHLMEGAKRF